MKTCDLTNKTCEPCEGGVDPLTREEIQPLFAQLSGWIVEGNKRIKKEFQKKDFAEAMKFVNAVANLAEEEGHHPDICIHGWNKVSITLSTHAIGGLSENDFIVAAKVDGVVSYKE